MSETLQISARQRGDTGKGASRRLRRQGEVPGILYGGHQEPQMLQLPHSELVKYADQEAFYSTLLDLDLQGEHIQVVLKDLQRHPAKPFILHVDFQRVSQGEKLRMTVPIHFDNEATCAAVKLGGQVSHNLTELEVLCLPKDLPEFIVVDMNALEIGQILHVHEMTLPDGVELDHNLDPDAPVVAIHAAHTGADEGADSEDE